MSATCSQWLSSAADASPHQPLKSEEYIEHDLPQTGSVRLTGELDPDVGRWQWLFKWLLAIPHFVVLAFLWIGFVVSTVVAGFAILFTGRYPRRIFTFNVGVLRWSWRVGFYTYSALGTDNYPPFSLADDPSYPARLEVAYPNGFRVRSCWSSGGFLHSPTT